MAALVKQTVGSSAGASVATQQVNFTSTTGNLLVLIYTRGSAATSYITSITDAAGNTWTLAALGSQAGSYNTHLEIWYAQNTVATTQITVYGNGASSNSWTVLEFSGIAATSALDSASPETGNASSTTMAAPSLTTSGAQTLVIAAAHCALTATTAVPAAPWTSTADFDQSATGTGRAAYRVVSSAGAYSAAWSLAASQPSGAATVAFTVVGDKYNNAEGGVNGATVTAGSGGNSGGASGDYYSAIPILGTAGSTCTFDSAAARTGSLGYKLSCVSGGAVKMQLLASNTAKTFRVRRYLRFRTAVPTDTTILVQFYNDTSGVLAQLSSVSSPAVFRGYANGVAVGSDSAAISAGTWYRVEITGTVGASATTGQITFNVYVGDSGTPFWTAASSACDLTTGTVNFVNMGKNSTGTFAGVIDADGDAFGDTSTVPYGPTGATTTVTGSRASTWTVSAPAGTATLVKQTVGSSGGTSATNQQINFTSTGGNLLVLLYARSTGGSAYVSSITDVAGNTWTLAALGSQAGSSHTHLEVWYAQNAAATTRITANASGTATNSWVVLEFSGIVATAALDAASPETGAASSSTVTTPSLTTHDVTTLVIAAANFAAATTTGPGSPWTSTSNYDDSGGGSGRGAYRVVSSVGTYSGSWSLGSSSPSGSATVAFTVAAPLTTKVTGTRASTWQVLIGPAKTVAGTVTPAGSEHRVPAKRPAGATTGAGTTVRAGLARTLTGTAAPVGAKLAAILGRRLYALVVPAGVTQRGYPRTVSGSVVAAATLSRRLMGRFPAGAVTAVGSLRRGFARTVTATVTGQAPSPKRFTAKRQASVSSPLGVAGHVAIRFRTYTGQITAAGLTLHRALGVKTGQLTGTGLLKPRTVWKVPKGAVAAVGVSVHVAFQRVFGRAGTATSTLTVAAETDTLIYQRQRAVITVSAVDAAAAVASWREVV